MTLSFKVKSLTNKNLYPDVFSYQGIAQIISRDNRLIGNNWQKISVTFRTNNVDYTDFYFYCFCGEGFSNGDTIWMDEPVLEWGNISSDWTPAPEDIQEDLVNANNAASNALNAANQAQANADAANAMLADISNDNKLTPVEKQSLKTEWETIQAEKPIVIAQANVYSLSTTAYNTTYDELNAYIVTQGLLNDLTTTTDIDGTYFRQAFKAYYTERTNLLKAISDKAKQIADAAQNTANQANLTAQQAQQGVINMQTSIDDIKTKTDNFLSINGGLLMGNILSVGDNQLNQRAFLSGVTDAGDNSIRFGAGANYANKNAAPFKVLDNGKLIASNAEITGNITATSGTFNGTVNAQQGTFGNTATNNYFNITANGLGSPQGWIVTGDYSQWNGESGGRFLQIQGGQTNGTAMLEIHNSKTDNLFHTCLVLNARGSSSGNVALDIKQGDIRIQGINGYTGFKTGGSTMYFLNGICVS